jgi:hypothetical protein
MKVIQQQSFFFFFFSFYDSVRIVFLYCLRFWKLLENLSGQLFKQLFHPLVALSTDLSKLNAEPSG